jgi:hypothetical protein
MEPLVSGMFDEDEDEDLPKWCDTLLGEKRDKKA